MEIKSNRISAKPRSKYIRYVNSSSYVVSSSGSGASIDTSNFVKLKGASELLIEGSVGATADLVAYQTKEHDITLPIASTSSLGAIKVGENLTIADDGTLSANASGSGGGVSSWNDLTDKPTEFKPSKHSHVKSDITDFAHKHPATDINTDSTHRFVSDTNISNWNTAYSNRHTHSNKSVIDGITSTNISHWNTAWNNEHTHSNKGYLDNINQYLSTSSNVTHNTLKCYEDVIAYSTGTASAPFKYWKPSVDGNGNLSWINDSSESTPPTVNIKGPKGDSGGNNGSLGSTVTLPNSGTVFKASGKDIGVKLSGGNGIIGWSTNATDNIGNLYLNYHSNSKYAKISDNCDVISTGSFWYATQGNFLRADAGSKFRLDVDYTDAKFYVGGYDGTAEKHFQFYRGSTRLMQLLPNWMWSHCNWSIGSDIRDKDKINNIENVLGKINNIDVFRYTYNYLENSPVYVGVSAQQVKEQYPDIVAYDKSRDRFSVDYSALGCIALQGVKELHQLVKDQQKQLDKQQAEIEELKQMILKKNETTKE